MIYFIVTDAARLSKDGKSKVLQVPLSYKAVNQYRKALLFLYDFQCQRRAVSWLSPNDNQNLALLLKHYRNNLVYDQVVTNAQSPSLPYT